MVLWKRLSISRGSKGHKLKTKVLRCLLSMERHSRNLRCRGLHEVPQVGAVGSRIPQVEKRKPR